jgi:hypothetical protein
MIPRPCHMTTTREPYSREVPQRERPAAATIDLHQPSACANDLTDRVVISSHRGAKRPWTLWTYTLMSTDCKVDDLFDSTGVSYRRVVAGSNYPIKCSTKVQQPRRTGLTFIRPSTNRSPASPTRNDPHASRW